MSFPSLQKPSPPEKETFCYQTKLPTRLVYRFQAVRSGRQKSRGAKPKKCLKKILSSRQALSCSKIDGDASTEWICQNSSGLLLPNPSNPPPSWKLKFDLFIKLQCCDKTVGLISSTNLQTLNCVHSLRWILSELKQSVLM